jgi:hypothetical protein
MTDTPIADDFAAIAANLAPPREEEQSDWPVGDLEPLVRDLRSTIEIFGHLITANSSDSDVVEGDTWRKVEDDLISLGHDIERLWRAAWDQHIATQTKHEAELAAVKAAAREEKAAPGSPADIKRAEALWSMLRAFVKVAAEECDETLAGRRSAEERP